LRRPSIPAKDSWDSIPEKETKENEVMIKKIPKISIINQQPERAFSLVFMTYLS
jgi:hypothetical protein